MAISLYESLHDSLHFVRFEREGFLSPFPNQPGALATMGLVATFVGGVPGLVG